MVEAAIVKAQNLLTLSVPVKYLFTGSLIVRLGALHPRTE